MTSHHWEDRRSDWLYDRSKEHTGRRRRAEQLAKRAARAGRASTTGKAEGGKPHDPTPGWWYRSSHPKHGGDGFKAEIGWTVWTAIKAGAVAVTVGPAMVVGLGLYGLWWSRTAAWGPIRWWPYAVAGAVLGVLGWFAVGPDPSAALSVQAGPHLVVEVEQPTRFVLQTVWVQGTLALLFAAWWSVECGWLAVKADADRVLTPQKDRKTGEFAKTAAKDKVRLTPYAEPEKEKD
ncbi:hypothetical protein GCM10027416_11350 [Okibacterium endophyticum]